MGEAATLGLASGTVRLIDYDPRWPALFRADSAELSAALRQPMSHIHHVGSTAIPGLPAKPILDILVLIRDFGSALELVPALAKLGYEYRPNGDISDRHFFRRRIGTSRTHHLSLAEPSSRYALVTLAFRDALREDQQLATKYSELKHELARQFPEDRESYTQGKTAFVLNVLETKQLT